MSAGTWSHEGGTSGDDIPSGSRYVGARQLTALATNPLFYLRATFGYNEHPKGWISDFGRN